MFPLKDLAYKGLKVRAWLSNYIPLFMRMKLSKISYSVVQKISYSVVQKIP